MKRIIAMIAAAIMLFACAAYAESGSYLFIRNEEGIFVSGYEGNEKVLHIPSAFAGEPVVGIAEGAFRDKKDIVEVYVPDNCRTVGVEAFAGCSSLRDVYFGWGLELIDERAFTGCDNLLSVSIVQYGFTEAENAFDTEDIVYNGADIAYFVANASETPIDMLYIAGCDLMSHGRFAEARDVFLSLYGYELSADYYFYCSARLYEQQGDVDSALAIYALTPDLNDCAERLQYYGAEPSVTSFFEGSDYTEYYENYFGEYGEYTPWLEYAGSAVKDAQEDTPAESSDNSAAEIGGGLAKAEATAAPQATPEPTATPAPVPLDPNLMSYHDFSGDMPRNFENLSGSEGIYTIYYYLEDLETVHDYIKVFEDKGWQIMREPVDGGMTYVYVVNEETMAYFICAYNEADGMLVFMYESAMQYGFDPVNGL